MSTPHIEASPGEFAELVLMPGDPLRAQVLAETVLDEARQVNRVRNMLAFTGTYQGHPVSIMGSGMGMPSISIYAHELFAEYGVQRIVRVGTCGALHADMQLGDLVMATAASTDSSMNRIRFRDYDLACAADFGMMQAIAAHARDAGLPFRAGEIMSTDTFYHQDPGFNERCAAMGILALDMESAALFALARQHGRRAATLLTVTDVIPAGLHASADERQNAFGAVIDTVLSALVPDPGHV